MSMLEGHTWRKRIGVPLYHNKLGTLLEKAVQLWLALARGMLFCWWGILMQKDSNRELHPCAYCCTWCWHGTLFPFHPAALTLFHSLDCLCCSVQARLSCKCCRHIISPGPYLLIFDVITLCPSSYVLHSLPNLISSSTHSSVVRGHIEFLLAFLEGDLVMRSLWGLSHTGSPREETRLLSR